MSLPASLAGRLQLPAIGSPMFIVSEPGARHRPVQGRHRRLVSGAERPAAARCSTTGSKRITDELGADARPQAPGPRPPRPIAVNQIVHKLQRPPRCTTSSHVREAQGAGGHHLARRAPRAQSRRVHSAGAASRSTTSSTSDHRASKAAGEGRGRPDRWSPPAPAAMPVALSPHRASIHRDRASSSTDRSPSPVRHRHRPRRSARRSVHRRRLSAISAPPSSRRRRPMPRSEAYKAMAVE
jgi:hypothetical protein